MKKIVHWLSTHRLINTVIIIVYFVAVVAPHKQFGTFLNLKVFKGITRDQYNLYVILAAAALLIGYLVVFIIRSNKLSDRWKVRSYMVANIAMAIVIINTLFVINIEVIHFPQYALLALLLFPIIGNYNGTLIWATLLGVVDEAYQYFYLAPEDTTYYDFNDVVTNLVGAVFGLLLLRSFNVSEIKSFRLKRSSIWYGVGIIVLATVIAHISEVLSIYPNDDRLFHILREWPNSFWTQISYAKNHPPIIFHIIRPIEGVALTIFLWVFYSRLRPGHQSENKAMMP